MYSNWALRSGWLEPSSAFRLTCRENPISMSSLRTLLGLIEWPMATSAAASLSRLFDTHSSGRTGSPSVTGSTSRLRSSSSVASLRSTIEAAAFTANLARSKWRRIEPLSPRPMVLRARPVTLDTAARPPIRRRELRSPQTTDDRVRPVWNRPLPNVANRPPIDHAIAGSALRRAEESPTTKFERSHGHSRSIPIHLSLGLSLAERDDEWVGRLFARKQIDVAATPATSRGAWW